jgi:hypothetical protein
VGASKIFIIIIILLLFNYFKRNVENVDTEVSYRVLIVLQFMARVLPVMP